jgi:hypothetical protein
MKVVFSYGIVLAALFLNVAGLNAAEQKSSRLVFSGYEGKEVLKDFPALVKLPGGLTGFKYSDAAPDGSDIAFYGEDGKKLSHEIDSWDVDGDSYIWVKVPQVSKTTAIVAKWGGFSKPLAKSSDVWSDDYLGVWHFSKFKKGISKDSKYGLEAKLRGKDIRKFIHADSLVGKGYFASAACASSLTCSS